MRTTAHTRAHKRTHARTHAHAAVRDRYQYHRAEVVLAGGRNSATQLAHYYYLRCAELGQPYGYLGLAHLVRACGPRLRSTAASPGGAPRGIHVSTRPLRRQGASSVLVQMWEGEANQMWQGRAQCPSLSCSSPRRSIGAAGGYEGIQCGCGL